MKISIGCDHAAVETKQRLAESLTREGHSVRDCGTLNNDSVDYPDFARIVVKDVQSGAAELGILICGTGIGMSISANKAKGIRAALISDAYSARMAKEHNNANVICFGSRVLGPELIPEYTKAFMGARFGGGKHERRVAKIMEMEGS